MAEADPTGDYCEYLDKEMTIMGLLTAFAVAVPALVLDRTAGAPGNNAVTSLTSLWGTHKLYIGLGCLMCFLSALMFYLQRSGLAFWYGQLRFSQTDARYKDLTTTSILADVDSWATWRSYTAGFVFLIIGFVCYGLALFFPIISNEFLGTCLVVNVFLPLSYLVIRSWVVSKYRYEDHPWKKCFPKVTKRLARMRGFLFGVVPTRAG